MRPVEAVGGGEERPLGAPRGREADPRRHPRARMHQVHTRGPNEVRHRRDAGGQRRQRFLMNRQLMMGRTELGERFDERATRGDDADAVAARDEAARQVEHAPLNTTHFEGWEQLQHVHQRSFASASRMEARLSSRFGGVRSVNTRPTIRDTSGTATRAM